jgi:hypothetical protein
MTLSDFMTWAMSIPVDLPCDACRRQPITIIYQHVAAVALKCPKCGHQWAVQWADNPLLKALLLKKPASR